MREKLGVTLSKVPILFAIPEPGAEGWMQADLSALRNGVSEALETVVHLPKDLGKYPVSEQAAKVRLGRILAEAGAPSLRNGLEYGPYVMRHVRYNCHPSLERFVRQLDRVFR